MRSSLIPCRLRLKAALSRSLRLKSGSSRYRIANRSATVRLGCRHGRAATRLRIASPRLRRAFASASFCSRRRRAASSASSVGGGFRRFTFSRWRVARYAVSRHAVHRMMFPPGFQPPIATPQSRHCFDGRAALSRSVRRASRWRVRSTLQTSQHQRARLPSLAILPPQCLQQPTWRLRIGRQAAQYRGAGPREPGSRSKTNDASHFRQVNCRDWRPAVAAVASASAIIGRSPLSILVRTAGARQRPGGPLEF